MASEELEEDLKNKYPENQKLTLRYDPDNNENLSGLVFDDDNDHFLKYNHYYLKEEDNKHDGKIRTYYFDKADHAKFFEYTGSGMDTIDPKLRYEIMPNLGKMLKFYPEKKIYLRFIQHWHYEYCKRVFAEEVLEILPLVLKQQGTPLEQNCERFKALQQKWKSKKKNQNRTMSLDECRVILNEFNVDPERITLVPDLATKHYDYRAIKLGDHPIITWSPLGHKVLRSSQAIMHIFDQLVFGVNWCRTYCKNPICLKHLRLKLVEFMGRFVDIDPQTFINLKEIDEGIEKFKAETCPIVWERRTVSMTYHDIFLLKRDRDDEVPLKELFSTCAHYDFPEPPNPPPEIKRSCVVKLCRVLYRKFAWSNFFRGRTAPKLRDVVEMEIYSKIEKSVRSFVGDPEREGDEGDGDEILAITMHEEDDTRRRGQRMMKKKKDGDSGLFALMQAFNSLNSTIKKVENGQKKPEPKPKQTKKDDDEELEKILKMMADAPGSSGY